VASPADISNLALGHLGDEANVTSISPPESTVQAEQSAKFYPIARDALLEAHAWSFNTRRKVLAEITNETTSWMFAYAPPANMMRPLSVLPPGATDDTKTEDFVVESLDTGELVIYTNTKDAELRYLVRVTDSTKFSPSFVLAFSWLLASYLAGPILRGRVGAQVAERIMKRFAEIEFPNAKMLDAAGRKLDATYRNYKPKWISDR
jgi:hypothetical protein